MAPRYRKVTVGIWSDARFRALSPIPPSGQALWFYLLTGRETTKIPGLIPAGKATLSESLRWKPEAFAKAFGEVIVQGIAKADWEAPLVWLPNAIKHNEPESPNVVRGWRDTWAEIPDCALKGEAWHGLKGYLEGLGEAFAKAFGEAVSKPCETPSPNQEQEQEQEQESPAALPFVDPRFTPATATLFAVFSELRSGGKPTFAKRQGKRLRDFLADHHDTPVEEITLRWRRCLSLGTRYPGTARVELFLDRWDEFTTTPTPASGKQRVIAGVGTFTTDEF